MSREHQFWTSGHKYEDLAKTFEQQIVQHHPNSVTSRRMCGCLKYGVGWCGWAVTKVSYYEYRGPRVTNL